MELVSTHTPADASGVIFSVELDDGELVMPPQQAEAVDPEFELGLWLAGLDSFLSLNGQLFAGTANTKGRNDDYTRHFRLTYAALLQCARLNIGLRRIVARSEMPEKFRFTAEELDELALALREVLILNEGLMKGSGLGHGEWRSWQATLAEKLRRSPVFARLASISGESCVWFLPERLQELGRGEDAFALDMRAALPRFARALKSLGIVGRMLRNDEPLKQCLMIFSYVYEQTRDLVTFMNNRLAKFPDDSAELFGLLDGASYTISMELRKVYQDELRSVIDIRPAPYVYARTEAAYSLLTESFQQILAGFARLSDPAVSIFELFSNFESKLNESLVLRADLWKMLAKVRAAEKSPDKSTVEALRGDLTAFLDRSLRYLFYKDTEAFERFCEEVFATDDKKDLVPVLHRFGAYLETLFGQINMRAALANHPFNAT